MCVILLLNVMKMLGVVGGALLDRPCMYGFCVFRELCPVSFLVVGECPSVLL